MPVYKITQEYTGKIRRYFFINANSVEEAIANMSKRQKDDVVDYDILQFIQAGGGGDDSYRTIGIEAEDSAEHTG
jgi:hypothetical protein